MTVTVTIDWTKNAKSPGFPTIVVVKHSQSRRMTGMQPAVEMVLAGASEASLQHGRLTRGLRGFKASEKTGDFPV